MTALVTSLVRAPGGAGQYTDIVDVTIPRLVAGSNTTAAFAAGSVYLYRFQLAAPMTITKMSIFGGATFVTDTVDLGIYTGTPGGTTFTRVAQTGPFTPTASDVTSRSLIAPISLSAGVPYWAALGNNNATNTILRISSSGTLTPTGSISVVQASAWSSGLPATVTITLPGGNGLIAWMAVVA